MVCALTHRAARRAIHHATHHAACLLCLLGLGWLSSANALGPAQPFAPPAKLSANDGAAALALATNGLTGLRLGSRPAALINGEWLHIGQTTRGAKLISITQQQAQLLHPDGRSETLLLAADSAPPLLRLTRVDAAAGQASDTRNAGPGGRVVLKSTP